MSNHNDHLINFILKVSIYSLVHVVTHQEYVECVVDDYYYFNMLRNRFIIIKYI